MTDDEKFLSYIPKYGVLVCAVCKIGIKPEYKSVRTHLVKHEIYYRRQQKALKHFKELLHRKVLEPVDRVELPQLLCTQFSELRDPVPGFLGSGCGKLLTDSENRIKKHVKEVCTGKSYVSRWLQQFYPKQVKPSWFSVAVEDVTELQRGFGETTQTLGSPDPPTPDRGREAGGSQNSTLWTNGIGSPQASSQSHPDKTPESNRQSYTTNRDINGPSTSTQNWDPITVDEESTIGAAAKEAGGAPLLTDEAWGDSYHDAWSPPASRSEQDGTSGRPSGGSRHQSHSPGRDAPALGDDREVKDIIADLTKLSFSLSLPRFTCAVDGFIRLLKGSVPADSDYVLTLKMDDVSREFEKPGGPSKPIFVPADGKDNGSVTIEELFSRWSGSLEADVQDPRNGREGYSRMKIADVMEAFRMNPNKRIEEKLQLNLLDLENPFHNVTPRGLTTKETGLLKEIAQSRRGLAHRKSSDWKCAEFFLLLSMMHSVTAIHQDASGLGSWVKCFEGRKLWLICYAMSDSEKQKFSEEGTQFRGGRWCRIWLNPGDTLIMPPSTVHSVCTVGDSLFAGGHFLFDTGVLSCLEAILYELKSNHLVTNDSDLETIADLASGIISRVNADPERFGNEREVQEILRKAQVSISPSSMYRD